MSWKLLLQRPTKPLVSRIKETAPDRVWFLRRYVVAADTVVRRWGPGWSQRKLLGTRLGVWLLLAAWCAIPALVAAVAFL